MPPGVPAEPDGLGRTGPASRVVEAAHRFDLVNRVRIPLTVSTYLVPAVLVLVAALVAVVLAGRWLGRNPDPARALLTRAARLPPLRWLSAVGVHTAGHLLVAGLIALLVYEKLGLAMLQRAWFNLDLLWVIALMLSGVLILVL